MMRRKWRCVRLAMWTSFAILLLYYLTSQLGADKYHTRRKTGYLQPMALPLAEEDYVTVATLQDEENPFHRHAFNVLTSNSEASDRSLPDTRPDRCSDFEYDLDGFESATVIITFYNEARSALLRTVVSVLNRTPPDLLQEIILVDDFSDNANDGSLLSALPKVSVIRNNERQGLIQSRNQGAEEARGDYLVFLDSHCEVNVGWLEPLMALVTKDPLAVAIPVIDVIDQDTFQYRPSTQLKGGFDWSLHFKWISLTEEEKAKYSDPTNPFPSPTIAGGLFLINKLWFRQLGGFDPGLNIWGGESLEISLKAWMCGGRLEVLPCSRIGHVFRKKHPYAFPEGNANTYLHNTKRVAEVWMGEHKRFFYESRPGARDVDAGSLDKQVGLREWLQCKPFQWYLENVFPELKLPNEENTAFGDLKQDSKCLTVNKTKDAEVRLTDCSNVGANQHAWSFSQETLEIKQAAMCLTTSNHRRKPYLAPCQRATRQKWARQGRSIVQLSSGLCLESGLASQVSLAACRHGAVPQQWDFTVELQTHDHAPITIM